MSVALGRRWDRVWARSDGGRMNTNTHIQHTGARRAAVVATIVAALLSLAPAGLAAGSARGGKGPAKSHQLRMHPMPGGGCGSGGCLRY
jgi:hypothetical protein